MTSRVKLIITDVDNTLYDWVGFYVPCFLAMVSEISRVSGIDEESLKRSFQRLHRRHGTSEYAFAVEELDVLNDLHPTLSAVERLRKYGSAIQAFRDCRRERLQLYPGVAETLRELQRRGIRLVAHSDSMIVPASRRLRQLDIDERFDAICAARDTGIPEYLPHAIARVAPHSEVAARTRLIELSPGIRKPNPQALQPILEAFSAVPAEVLYVGDSLTKDIRMAKALGITAVFAQYGRTIDHKLYEELLKVTFWTTADVGAEEAATTNRLTDEAVAINQFSDLIPLLESARS